MPFLFIIVGVVFAISAVRNTTDQLTSLLKSDFTGNNNFVYWLLSILVIGAVGYIPDLKPVSRAFLVLVVIVLFLKNGGVFSQFVADVKIATANSPFTSSMASLNQSLNIAGYNTGNPNTNSNPNNDYLQNDYSALNSALEL